MQHILVFTTAAMHSAGADHLRGHQPGKPGTPELVGAGTMNGSSAKCRKMSHGGRWHVPAFAAAIHGAGSDVLCGDRTSLAQLPHTTD